MNSRIDYNIFKIWLDKCLLDFPINKKINGIYFGLFESKDNLKLYLTGSTNYSKNNEDWACDEDYIPSNNYCNNLNDINELFDLDEDIFVRMEKIINLLKNFIFEYLNSNKDSVLNNKEIKIAIGFDEGDLIVI